MDKRGVVDFVHREGLLSTTDSHVTNKGGTLFMQGEYGLMNKLTATTTVTVFNIHIAI